MEPAVQAASKMGPRHRADAGFTLSGTDHKHPATSASGWIPPRSARNPSRQRLRRRPEIIAGQVDVLPADRCEVAQQCCGHDLTLVAGNRRAWKMSIDIRFLQFLGSRSFRQPAGCSDLGFARDLNLRSGAQCTFAQIHRWPMTALPWRSSVNL